MATTTTESSPDEMQRRRVSWQKLVTGEWVCDHTTSQQRRFVHYWLTIIWFTVGLVVWIILRDALWFVGFMSLYAIESPTLPGGRLRRPSRPKKRPTPSAARSCRCAAAAASEDS